MTKITAAITGVNGYVPEYILTNAELESMVETTDEWIESRTGIKERRILKGKGLGTSFMGVKAVKGLLEKTNTDPNDIDLLICATITPDYFFPSTANLICDEVGIKNTASYDLSAACSGFINALVTGTTFIESGRYKKIIIVGADKMSSIIDYTDRNTCVIFGDGAGAILLEPSTPEFGIQDFILRSDGSGKDYLIQKGGGSVNPPTTQTIEEKMHYISQNGPDVFKFAVVKMADVSAEIMDRNNLTGENVAYLVPHQANKRILDATAKRMGIGEEKVMINIEKYGNTTAATIPLCLWDYEHKINKGDNLILAAFGGGFTWGSVYLKWAY